MPELRLYDPSPAWELQVRRSLPPDMIEQLPLDAFLCDSRRELHRLFHSQHVPLVALESSRGDPEEYVYRGAMLGRVARRGSAGHDICTVDALHASGLEDERSVIYDALLGTLQEIRGERGWKRILAKLLIGADETDFLMSVLEKRDFALARVAGNDYIYAWPHTKF